MPYYVFDADSLINLEKKVPLWNFPLPGGSIIITQIVAGEIKRGIFRYENWLQSGKLENLQGEEQAIFYELCKQQFTKINGKKQEPVQIHDGEASVLAISLH